MPEEQAAAVRFAVQDLLHSEGLHIVASCLGESTGGGLIHLDGARVEVIDRLSTTGLHALDDRVVRALWCKDENHSVGELLTYDGTGVRHYLRADSLKHTHDVRWNGSHFVCISTATNSILWIAPDGEVTRSLVMPGEADSWHLNSLFLDEGRLVSCAFGRFSSSKGWRAALEQPDGIVFDVETGEDLITGLMRPHHPRRMEADQWLVCNSSKRELLQVDAISKRVVRAKQLQLWTRGLAVTSQYIIVGESARRGRTQGDNSDQLAFITLLDRFTWETIGSVPLPFEEVYDVVLVRSALLQGLRNGFRTNNHRVLEQNQVHLFESVGVQPTLLWALGELIPAEDRTVRIAIDVEDVMKRNSWQFGQCSVRNLGRRILPTAKPHPIYITYRWINAQTREIVPGPGSRTPLAEAVAPNEITYMQFRFRAPETPGEYELVVSLVQGGNFWGDQAEANMARVAIMITR